MNPDQRTAWKYWPAVIECWMAWSLVAFILIRVAGSATVKRTVASLLGR